MFLSFPFLSFQIPLYTFPLITFLFMFLLNFRTGRGGRMQKKTIVQKTWSPKTQAEVIVFCSQRFVITLWKMGVLSFQGDKRCMLYCIILHHITMLTLLFMMSLGDEWGVVRSMRDDIQAMIVPGPQSGPLAFHYPGVGSAVEVAGRLQPKMVSWDFGLGPSANARRNLAVTCPMEEALWN